MRSKKRPLIGGAPFVLGALIALGRTMAQIFLAVVVAVRLAVAQVALRLLGGRVTGTVAGTFRVRALGFTGVVANSLVFLLSRGCGRSLDLSLNLGVALALSCKTRRHTDLVCRANESC